MKPCPTCAESLQDAALVCRFCQYDFRTGAGPGPKRSGSPLAIIIIVPIVVVIVIGAVGLTVLDSLMSSRASNDRNASATLKTLMTAEADFRSNDRDNDGAANFWVRDVYGLYALCPSPDRKRLPEKLTPENEIKLIEPSLAYADAGGAGPGPGCMRLESPMGLKGCYGYLAVSAYESDAVAEYAEEGGIAAFGRSYNAERFAFVAVPNSRKAAKALYLVTQEGTVYKMPLTETFEATYNEGPGRLEWREVPFTRATPCPRHPLRSGWQKLD